MTVIDLAEYRARKQRRIDMATLWAWLFFGVVVVLAWIDIVSAAYDVWQHCFCAVGIVG